jgi:hypothetical protein
MDFRFRRKNGRAADVTATTDFDPHRPYAGSKSRSAAVLLCSLDGPGSAHPVQNISGLRQGPDQPFDGTLIVR